MIIDSICLQINHHGHIRKRMRAYKHDEKKKIVRLKNRHNQEMTDEEVAINEKILIDNEKNGIQKQKKHKEDKARFAELRRKLTSWTEEETNFMKNFTSRNLVTRRRKRRSEILRESKKKTKNQETQLCVC